jgi:hypothetical protein
MFKIAATLMASLALTACVTTVPDNPDGSGRQIGEIRQFILPTRDRLNVTRQGAQVLLEYPIDYPLTDAEAASYVEDATGCRPGALLASSSTQYNRAIHRTYALTCS